MVEMFRKYKYKKCFFICIVLTGFFVTPTKSLVKSCWSKNFKGGTVCVCNKYYCDEFPKIEQVDRRKFLVFTTNKDGLRFRKYEDFAEKFLFEFEILININPKTRYQEVFGFGGTFTDSTGVNINSLDEVTKNTLMKNYFSKDGLQYNLCRVPIGCTDSGYRPYTYSDEEVDKNLMNFKLQPEDYKYRIPLLKEAIKLRNEKLNLIGSTWAAPKWMKTNNEYYGNGYIKQEMYQVWADYFIKFFDEYKKENISFWGVTTQNEPALGYVPFLTIPTVMWKAEQMSTWVANNLGPTIRSSNHSNLKIICIDDQRFHLPWLADLIFSNERAKQYIDGIGIHWYFNRVSHPNLLTQTHEKYPEKFILATEACHRNNFEKLETFIGSWDRGMDYAVDILENLENWGTGWIDWNMALDMVGGPTYISDFNLLDAPILVNATAGEFYKQPMFYAIGHFSKFITPGSIRIGIKISDIRLQAIAFIRPDNAIVVIVLNRNIFHVNFKIEDITGRKIVYTASPQSINSVIYWN